MKQPFLEQMSIALELRLKRGELELLDLGAAVEIDDALLEGQPRLRLGVGLDGEVLRELVDVEAGLG